MGRNGRAVLGIENIAASQYSNLVSISLLLIGVIATVSYAYHAIPIKMRYFMDVYSVTKSSRSVY
jgi:hypothetical protein